jgi:hypothetical protein
MALLSKSAISAASDLERVTVDVPEWGGEVSLQVPSVADFEAWNVSRIGEDGEFVSIGARASLVALCLVDGDGVRMFSDGEVEGLAQKSWKVIDRLFEQCKQLAGVDDAEVEETEKN